MRITVYPTLGLLAIITACGTENESSNALAISTPNAVKGEALFQQVCTSCHGISSTDNKPNAPVLSNLKANWPNISDLQKFVQNPPANMQMNNHTKALYEQWKTNIQMPPYSGLSNQEVADVVAYLYTL